MKQIALALMLTVPVLAFAQEATAPTSETNEQKFIRLTRELEQRGFQDGLDSTTGFLISWGLGESGYQTVDCEAVGSVSRDLPSAFAAASIFGNLAWQMEHGKDSDELSKQLAGTVTGLRVYSATVRHDPTFPRSAVIDALIAKMDAGTLRDYIAPFVAKNCTSPGALNA